MSKYLDGNAPHRSVLLRVKARGLRREAGDAGRHLLLPESLNQAELVLGSHIAHEGRETLHLKPGHSVDGVGLGGAGAEFERTAPTSAQNSAVSAATARAKGRSEGAGHGGNRATGWRRTSRLTTAVDRRGSRRCGWWGCLQRLQQRHHVGWFWYQRRRRRRRRLVRVDRWVFERTRRPEDSLQVLQHATLFTGVARRGCPSARRRGRRRSLRLCALLSPLVETLATKAARLASRVQVEARPTLGALRPLAGTQRHGQRLGNGGQLALVDNVGPARAAHPFYIRGRLRIFGFDSGR